MNRQTQFNKRLALMALGLLLAIGFGGYPFIPAPKVQGYSLKNSVRKISYNAPIKLTFTQPMEKSSVEKAFHIKPALQGAFRWDKNALLFTPKEPLKIGAGFQVSLDKTAKSMFLKPLDYEYLENFEIVGSPKVLLFSPEETKEDTDVDAKITVHFDRPMTALTSLDNNVAPSWRGGNFLTSPSGLSAETKPVFLKFNPPIEGRAKWLGTSTFSFIPNKLRYATSYTITVPKGTMAMDGGTTEQDFVYNFDTIRPEIAGFSPEDLSIYNGPSTTVKLTFNQPMEVLKTKKFIRIWLYKGETAFSSNNIKAFRDAYQEFVPSKWQEVAFEANYYTLQEYKIDHDIKETDRDLSLLLPKPEELKKTIVLKPTRPLPDDSLFMVKVDRDFTGVEGLLPMSGDRFMAFKTVGEVKVNIVETTPKQGEDNYDIGNGIVIPFNQPIDPTGLENSITIEPKTIDKTSNKEKNPTISAENNSGDVRVYYGLKPSTAYTLTVKKGLKTRFGKVLKEDFVLRFKTAPLAPHFELVKQFDMSVLDGNKPPVFYVKTTNVNTLHFELLKLDEQQFGGLYQYGYLNFNRNGRPAGAYRGWDKKVPNEMNKMQVNKIDLSKELNSGLDAGYYYFELSSPEVVRKKVLNDGGLEDNQDFENAIMAKHVFMITKTALATKMTEKQLLVWATSLKDGAPVAGMNISVRRSAIGEEILSGTTDREGLVAFDLLKKQSNELAVVGKLDNDITMTRTTWAEGINPWNFNIDYRPQEEKYFAYIYTERPIYRPGHTVYFKGIVRAHEDVKFALPDGKKVHVIIKDSRDNKVYEKDIVLNSNGTFHDELQLSENGHTGNYSIQATLQTANEKEADKEISYPFYQSFLVAAYRKPDYKLTIENDKKNYVNGEQAKIKVTGQYFFGAPLANAKIAWTIKSEDYYFFLPADSASIYASKWFSFSNDGQYCYWGCRGEAGIVTQGKAVLDSNGQYTITLPLDIKGKKLSQFYTVEVTAFDINDQSVSNRVTMPVHQGEYYIGIMRKDSVVQKGKEAIFEIIAVGADGKPVGSKNLEISLFKREWNTIQKKNVDSDFYYENNYENIFAEKKSVFTDEKGHGVVSFTPKNGGDYRVFAEGKDSRGNKIAASTLFYTTDQSFINWGEENNDRIELVPDKLEYKIGDTAHILVKSPYRNVYALVTHERANILQKKVIKIVSNAQTIDVPITEKSLPNIFVSVLLVKGNENAAGLVDPKEKADERDIATFKIGYATLQVENSSKKMAVKVETDRQKYHPGDEVTVKIKTTDGKGKPVKAELSIGVVDESVLSLTENVTADLLVEFYRKRALGVLTAHTLTKALSRLNVQVEAGMKGGSGGKPGRRGIFKDTAYWQAVINTNEAGEATTKFKLPDNLTTWQILAIGMTRDTLVGSQKASFVVTKDVLVRPVLPRFLIVNDQMIVGAVLHNYLEKPMDFDVNLKATGVTLKGGSQRIRLEPGQEKRVDFSLTVNNETEASFIFEALAASDQKIGDIIDIKLPIQSFSFPEVVATSTVLSDDTKHVDTIWLPDGVNQKFGELTISVAPTFAGSIIDGIGYLVKFPYGCVEQTASAILGNLAAKNLMDIMPSDNKVIDLKDLQHKVEIGLQGLYKYQQPDGGWGLWYSSRTAPYLSAYALFTLNEANKAGYSVDEKVFNNGLMYLKKLLQNQQIQKNNNYEANTRAFVLYVLSEMGEGDLGLSNNLLEYRDNLNLFAKTYLAMDFYNRLKRETLESSVQNNIQKNIDVLKRDIVSRAKETPRGAHFEEKQHDYAAFDTDTRTDALVLQMLAKIDPENPLAPKLLRHLLIAKKDGHFSSTQETVVSLLALVDYLKISHEFDVDYTGAIAVNNVPKLKKSFTKKNIFSSEKEDKLVIPLTDLLPNNQDNEIVAMRSGKGKMYVDMNLKYYVPTEEIAQKDEGIVVTQEYFGLDDKKQEHPLTEVKVGENLKGKITVIVPENRYYVMVEDFLPAGLEGIDFTLKTSQQGLQEGCEPHNDGEGGGGGGGGGGKIYACADTNWAFNYSEVRDDRMMYFADFLPKGVYEIQYFARATTRGVFHDLPTVASELYFPEVFGRSKGRSFVVK